MAVAADASQVRPLMPAALCAWHDVVDLGAGAGSPGQQADPAQRLLAQHDGPELVPPARQWRLSLSGCALPCGSGLPSCRVVYGWALRHRRRPCWIAPPYEVDAYAGLLRKSTIVYM